MSQYVLFTVLSYLLLVPIGWSIFANTRPPRLRVAGVALDFVPSSTDHGGLI